MIRPNKGSSFVSPHRTQLPRPDASQLYTTESAAEVKEHIGFTYATVFQDDYLVPGFTLTYVDRPKVASVSPAATGAEGGSGSSETPSMILEERSVLDSWVELKVPLATNNVYRKAFADVDGSARVGRIMEIADGLAADVGYRHTVGGYSEAVTVTIATASIDSLVINGREFVGDADMTLCAYCTKVGKSSMEVCVEMEQQDTATRAFALFIMVAIDQTTGRTMKVPGLEHIPVISEEAAKRSTRRAGLRKQSHETESSDPSDDEMRLLHKLWKKFRDGRGAGGGSIANMAMIGRAAEAGEQFMRENRLESTLLIWPNEMNVHNTLFGGVLVRNAIEVAYMTVAQYLRSTAWAALMAVDDVFFVRPIPSGAMIKQVGQVIYTEGPDMVVRVEVLVCPPRQHPAVWQRATVFYLHFRWPPIVPGVLPQAYEEFLLYLEGQRRHNQRLGISVAGGNNIGPTTAKL